MVEEMFSGEGNETYESIGPLAKDGEGLALVLFQVR
jgi:hypothetical protein